MEDTQVNALQKQVEHWQHKFKDEEHHNRELQLQLDTAMADRSKLSHDLRVKTILMEDMSKELEELNVSLSSCTCKATPVVLQQEIIERQDTSSAAEDTGLRVRTGREDSQFILRMLIVERQLQWILHKDLEDQKNLLDDQKFRIGELENQVSALTITKDQLTEDVTSQRHLCRDQMKVTENQKSRIDELLAEVSSLTTTRDQLSEDLRQQKQLRHDAEESVAELNTRSTELNKELQERNKQLQDTAKEQQKKDTKLCEKSELITNLEATLKETKRMKMSLEDRLKNMTSKFQAKCRETDALKLRLQSDEIEEGELEGEVEIIQNEMPDDLKTHVIQLVRQKAKLHKGWLNIAMAVSQDLNQHRTNYWYCTIGHNFQSSLWKTPGKHIAYLVNGIKVIVFHKT